MARTQEWIRASIRHPCSVSVSWGKDSTVALFLALPALTSEDWILHVSPGEYDLPDTPAVRDIFCARFPLPAYREIPSRDYFDAARAYGLTDVLIKAGAVRRAKKKTDLFAQGEEGAAMRIWGSRAEESGARKIYGRANRALFFSSTIQRHILSPLIWWTWQDVWSIMVANDLPYCEVYDKYDAIEQLNRGRAGAWAGTRAAPYGRIAYLKHFYPNLYARFVRAFPEISAYV